MASLFTGLQPWRHGGWHGERPILEEKLKTLPEALRGLGFRTSAFRSNVWLTAGLGYAQGFDEFRDFDGPEGRPEQRLASLDGSPEFVWIHVFPPHAPYVLRRFFRDRLERIPEDLPEVVETRDLEPYFDPRIPLPTEMRERFWALYQINVAHADREVGRLLEALRWSGHWDDTFLIVTSDHGEEFGEAGQIGHGGNLHRALIEVPLFIKLPRGSPRTLTPRPWVANLRVFSTIVESAGGQLPEDVAPSLFEDDQLPALSELYLIDSTNTFSLVEGGRQLLWKARFHAPEREFFLARRMVVMGSPVPMPSEHPEAIFERIRRAFLVAPPLRGAPEYEPVLRSDSWSQDPAEAVQAQAKESAQAMRRLWIELNGEDRPPVELGEGSAGPQLTPEERRRLRAMGYLAGG
jgi:hypothetical protein